MKKEQRPAATGFCANVEKMDLYAVDRREKLRVSVQACLDRAPIIVVSPVGLDALQKFDLRAICPGFPTKQLRPSRAVEALPQVDEVGLGDAELEIGRASGRERGCQNG